MLRPRRTTEFENEGNGANNKRLSKPTRSMAGPSPQPAPSKLPTRTSRVRPPSLERDRNTMLPGSTSKLPRPTIRLTASASKPVRTSGLQLNSTTKAGRTPNNARYLTPSHVAPGQMGCSMGSVRKRVLFTGDHNDKSWVQARVRVISAYLQKMLPPGRVPGIGPDFFKQGAGLRQMSVRQFAGIVNFFLGFIGRQTVGTNHVEDIISILQKLNYPNTINKSSLMTPNTPHSIGHIVVILDFLMDFAPPLPEDLTDQPPGSNINEFPLADEGHFLSFTNSISQLHSNESEAQKIYLQNIPMAFQLWDNKEERRLDEWKQHTADLIVQKRSDLSGVTALEADIKRLLDLNENLKLKMPSSPAALERKCKELRAVNEKAEEELEACRLNLRREKQHLEKHQEEVDKLRTRCEYVEQQIAELMREVYAQPYKPEERDKQMAEVELLRKQSQFADHELSDLREYSVNMQVSLSRKKKELTDLTEKVNQRIRYVKYSGVLDDKITGELNELGLRINTKHIKSTRDALKRAHEALQIRQRAYEQQSRTCMLQIERIKLDISSKLAPKKAQLEARVASLVRKRARTQTEINQTVQNSMQQREALEDACEKLDEQIQQQELVIMTTKEEVRKLHKVNESTVADMEAKQAISLAERSRRLDMIEKVLDFEEPLIKQLIAKKRKNRALIEQQTKELEELLELNFENFV